LRVVCAAELPQGVQRLRFGDRLTLAGQIVLGLFAYDGDEKVVHGREVVVHEGGLDAGLGCDPPRRRSRIALVEHDLGSRLDQRLPGRFATSLGPLVSRGAGHEGTLSVERPPNNCFLAN
jgi:hypothetical protein